MLPPNCMCVYCLPQHKAASAKELCDALASGYELKGLKLTPNSIKKNLTYTAIKNFGQTFKYLFIYLFIRFETFYHCR